MDKGRSPAHSLHYPDWLQIHAKDLEGKFGPALPDVRQAMEELAASFTHEELEERAYYLCVEFRPQIPAGKQGWGAKGRLDTDRIRSLAGR